METFGIVAMGMSVFGLLAWMQLQAVSQELKELKKTLSESGVLNEDSDSEKKG